jgi:hypothetical protein
MSVNILSAGTSVVILLALLALLATTPTRPPARARVRRMGRDD